MKTYKINTDGAIRPFNPGGLGAYGFCVFFNDGSIYKEAKTIGFGEGMTNNVAEYTGVVSALEWLNKQTEKYPCEICSDSQLVIRQINGEYECRKPELRILLRRIQDLVKIYQEKISFSWIRREMNKFADELAGSVYTEEIMKKFHGQLKMQNSSKLQEKKQSEIDYWKLPDWMEKD